MLTQYKNIDDILASSKPINGKRINVRKNSIQQFVDEEVVELLDTELPANCEMHIYSGKTWITGEHVVKLDLTATNPAGQVQLYNPVRIPVLKTVQDTKLVTGTYQICTNFFTDILGTYKEQYLTIQEISPDRTEVKLRLIYNNLTEPTVKTQLINFVNTVSKTQTRKLKSDDNKSINYFTSYLLNFSRNQCVSFVNSVVIGDFIYVKLLDPLSDIFDIDYKCWIVKEHLAPYIDRISIEAKPVVQTQSKMLPANFSITIASNNADNKSKLQSWGDLVGTNKQASSKIINSVFSGSFAGMQLNIDLSDFNNFVFYSSATERLYNFRSKLQQLESYTAQSASYAASTGATAKINALDYETKQFELIGGFDAFEEYLYYESSSKLTTYDIPLINPTVPHLTGSYIQPAPKRNSTFPYTLYSVSSSAFTSWYTNLNEKAITYDSYNFNALQYAIPEYIKLNESNLNLASYVNIIGHFFDMIYVYVNHQGKLYSTEENPNLGTPNELLPGIAKQFGWILSNSTTSSDLDEYVAIGGNNQSLAPGKGSSEKLRIYSIQRRIVNNLPYILKTRGTNRGVRSLAAIYGIDQSKLTVKEYSNNIADINTISKFRKQNYERETQPTKQAQPVAPAALVMPSGSSGLVIVNVPTQVNTVQLRFKSDSVIKNPTIPTIQNIVRIDSHIIDIQYTSGTNGVFLINGVDTSNAIEMFDDNWISLNVSTDGTNLNLLAKESFNGEIISAASASSPGTISANPTIVLGATGSARLQGSLQELRLWSSVINESVFDNHVTAPSAYNGNVDAYDELLFRLPFDRVVDHLTTGSLSGDQPLQSALTASFTSWSPDVTYDFIDSVYYFDTPNIGPSTVNNLNVRVVDVTSEDDALDPNISTEIDDVTTNQSAGKLDVYFSPQNDINNDIISYFGNVSLDDYIGDPTDYTKNEYPDLIKKSKQYWRKFSDRFDLNKWIQVYTSYDVSFFDNVQQTIPANTAGNIGFVIQPTLLERSKDHVLPTIKNYNDTYEALITDVSPALSSSYDYYTADINNIAPIVDAIDITQYEISLNLTHDVNALNYAQLNLNLTASADKKYNGTKYNYDYVYWTGISYVTGSSPYWRREAVLPILNDATLSEYRYKSNDTGSLARTQDLIAAGINNHRYAGCKMTSPDFNINSTQTIDGGPVVEFNENSGNQLFYQSVKNNGSFYVS